MDAQYHPRAADTGQRLDTVLVQLSKDNKTRVGKQIKAGLVRVNGLAVTKAGYKLLPGDSIDYPLEDTSPARVNRHPLSLPICYEDSDVLIVDKPAGLLVHPASRPDVASVVDFSRLHTTDDDLGRPGIVHRLDRETSGLLIIAKTSGSKAYLQQAFKKHEVGKHYQALVYGHLDQDEGVIDLPIDRAQTKPTQRQVSLGGRSAKTKYRVLAVYTSFSLLELEPYTGRTHQLRVHLSHIGHPIVGDMVYGSKGRDNLGLSRQFLHATQLDFTGPNRQNIHVVSPLPAELENVLAVLS